MTKHTPGPWKVYTTNCGTKVIGIGEAKDGAGILDGGFGVWRDGPEALANAHLAASAPDLLEALEYIEMAMANETINAHSFEIVRRVIAKAKGE